MSLDMKESRSAELTHAEINRYSRHLLLSEVGLEGQKKLKAASVLVIGIGGLGSPIAMYLAAAGVGRLGLVDMDIVETSNLQRQIIHRTEDVGVVKKVESAKRAINSINPLVKVDVYDVSLTAENALEIAQGYDILIDGTDNFTTRYLVNDISVLLNRPNIYGSIFRFEGQASVFWAEKGACYRCLYPEPPPADLVPNCAEGGVLGVLPGMIGTIQANEAIKIILGQGEPLINRLLVLDALSMRFNELVLQKNPDCPLCGKNPTINKPINYHQFCGVDNLEPSYADENHNISSIELARKLNDNSITLIDVRSPEERAICFIEKSISIPLSQLQDRLPEMEKSAQVVIYCKSGVRGAQAVRLLRDEGFLFAKNLSGGIHAWSMEIDENVPTY